MIMDFHYDIITNETICEIKYDNKIFIGKSKCHPDDTQFYSQRTGGFIAEARATIKVLKYKRNHEIIPILNAFKHLQNNMKTSKNYNPKSYEAKMIYNQIKMYEFKLNSINADIEGEKTYLSDYIKNKNLMYEKYLGKNK